MRRRLDRQQILLLFPILSKNPFTIIVTSSFLRPTCSQNFALIPLNCNSPRTFPTHATFLYQGPCQTEKFIESSNSSSFVIKNQLDYVFP